MSSSKASKNVCCNILSVFWISLLCYLGKWFLTRADERELTLGFSVQTQKSALVKRIEDQSLYFFFSNFFCRLQILFCNSGNWKGPSKCKNFQSSGWWRWFTHTSLYHPAQCYKCLVLLVRRSEMQYWKKLLLPLWEQLLVLQIFFLSYRKI